MILHMYIDKEKERKENKKDDKSIASSIYYKYGFDES